MVPKALSRSRQPENEEPSSTTEEEEEENEDGGSESHTSEGKEDASGETPIPKSNLENGSDSDSDLGSPSDYKLQPVSRKRINQESQSPAVNSATKKSKTAAGSSTPGGCITRLWSDEDEATLLNGIIDYKNSTGHSFNADLGAFYRFIQGKLRIDIRKDQLTAKIRRIKKRFSDASKKSGNVEDPVFSKPHDVKMFELSKKIWSGSVGNVSNGKSIKVGENSSVANNGKSVKKGENVKKQHAVEVELDEKEKDNGESVKKGKTVKKHAGEVELDEKKKDNGKSVEKGETVKKHVGEVELDEKKKDDDDDEEEEEEEEDEDEDEEEVQEEEMEEGVGFQSKYPFLSGSFNNLMSTVPSMVLPESGVSSALKRMSSIRDGKAKELDDKWKQLIMEEVELSHKKLTLMKEQMRMAFDH